jgi:AcrR family transcriptional regulator
MDVKGRKAEQSEATRAALLRTARELFAERGYADTPTEEIVKRAGVTRGALYHHFRDKQDLFRALVEEMEAETTSRVAEAAMSAGGVWEGIVVGLDTFLDHCLDPEVRRIILIDAPSVLGPAAWREIETKYGLALLQHALGGAMEAGVIERQPLEPLAHLLSGALNEAALMIGAADDPKKARDEVGESVARLLEGLKPRR